MLNIVDNYKEIELEIDGETRIEQINTSDAWNVFEATVDGKNVKIQEGDNIEFAVESSGEIKTATVVKMTGKGEKTKIQIMPVGSDCEEIWSIMLIAENSLKRLERNQE